MVHPLIAILDDEDGFRRALSRLLGAHAFATQAFGSGVEFLTELPQRRFDCLLLDLVMPGLTGLDVLAYMRGHPMAPPVIVVCGHDDPELLERARDLGALECLAKPVREADLMGAIGRALRGGHSSSAAA